MTEKPPGFFSGGPIEAFREGWAKMVFHGDLGHFWRVNEASGEVRSYCGMVLPFPTNAHPLNVGNWPLCKRCRKIATRWPTKEERATLWEDPRVREMFR